MELAPTTELEAVNVMLETIGEAPINSLVDASQRTDIARAQSILREVHRTVMGTGWDFNTDEGYTLALANNGTISVPTDALSIDPTDPSANYVERGRLLWDRDNFTNIFTTPVECDIVRFLTFEDTPEAFRYYVAVRSARVFQRRILGDADIEQYTEDDEYRALVVLQQNHTDTRDSSFLNDADIYRTRRSRRA